jgi:exodeoxyribonuclease V gamma subunit
MREVFQIDGVDEIRIPVRIHGGRKSDKALVSESILQAMHLAGSRFKVTEVLDWMEQAPILGSYMDEHKLRPLLHRWIEEQQIRWGSYKDHVSTPDFELNGRHTWEHGFERLLLAKIGSEDQDFEFDGVLSGSGVVTQAESQFLGRVLMAFDALERLRLASKSTESVSDWVDFLVEVIELCVDPNWRESADQVRSQLYSLKKIDKMVKLEAVSMPILNSFLKEQLQKGGLGRSWHPGEVTFTGMVSLHTIPFKVIAVLGLNDGSLPGRTPVSPFDLIPKVKRKGDRVRRLADRQLFLDYLITPSKHLHLSYTGLRQTDNKSIAPSVMIPILGDNLKRISKSGRFFVPKEYLHRLQPFHPDYFSESGVIRSYSKVNAALAQTLSSKRDQEFETLLPELTPELMLKLTEMGTLSEVLGWEQDTEVSVSSFVSFFSDPCRFVLREVIGVDLREGDVPSEDDEPLTIDGLSAWKIRHEMVSSVIEKWEESGEVPSEESVEAQMSGFMHRYELMGWIPDALAGKSRITKIMDQSKDLIRAFEATVATFKGQSLHSPEIDLEVDLASGLSFVLKGSLEMCIGDQCIRVEVGSASPARDFKYWIKHVLLNSIQPIETTVIYPDDTPKLLNFGSMDQNEALRHIRNLGWFFLLGQRFIMPLYASMSEVFTSKIQNGDDLASLLALQDTLLAEDSFNRSLSDAQSVWVRHVWRDADLLETSVTNAELGGGFESMESVSEIDVEVFTKIDAFRVFSRLIYKEMMEDRAK